MAASGDDAATITNWLTDLTFAEAHAMIYGGVHGGAAVGAYVLGFNDLALGLVGVFIAFNGWWGTERTRDLPLVGTIMRSIPKQIRGQIRDELHYYDGLFVLCGVAAFGVSVALDLAP